MCCPDVQGFYHCEEEVRQFLEEVFPGKLAMRALCES